MSEPKWRKVSHSRVNRLLNSIRDTIVSVPEHRDCPSSRKGCPTAGLARLALSRTDSHWLALRPNKISILKISEENRCKKRQHWSDACYSHSAQWRLCTGWRLKNGHNEVELSASTTISANASASAHMTLGLYWTHHLVKDVVNLVNDQRVYVWEKWQNGREWDRRWRGSQSHCDSSAEAILIQNHSKQRELRIENSFKDLKLVSRQC